MKKKKNYRLKGGGEFFNIFKFAAISSAGAMVGILPQMLIGTIILLIGIYLVTKNKQSNTSNNTNKKEYNYNFTFYLGVGLIIIGSVISLNLFFEFDFLTGLFIDN